MPGAAATTQQLLPPGHPLLGAAAWSQYHLAVTVQRDEEASSVATRLDGYHPEAPAVSLDSFIDGERAASCFFCCLSCCLAGFYASYSSYASSYAGRSLAWLALWHTVNPAASLQQNLVRVGCEGPCS